MKTLKHHVFRIVRGGVSAALLAVCGLPVSGAPPSEAAARAVESAHTVLWAKFVGPDGIIRDYVGELPTPEECAQGKPNAIGWWSPIENGPMFTGLYLPAACERARRSGSPEDKEKARRLAEGLLLCASVSDVPGFIARGVGTDGKCHYPMGSDDQTHPWFFGLHAYVASGLPGAAERERIVAKMREVADVLESTGWRCPCDGAFKGQYRGGYKGHLFRDAVRYLHLLRVMADVTGDAAWLRRYRAALAERPERSDKTRAEICAVGYPLDREAIANIDATQLWIYVGSQGALARLAALETDGAVLALYRAGLAVNATNAFASIGAYRQFDNADTKAFGHAKWREGYPEWFPQKTQEEAQKLAKTGDKAKLGERKWYEARFMKNPLAAAAVVALAGGEASREEIERAIAHFDYTKLNMAELFFAECAWYALPESADRPASMMPVAAQVMGAANRINRAALPFLEQSDLFVVGDSEYKLYHIPGIVVTAKGSVLVWCEARKKGSDWDAIDILLRRSSDNGKTFDASRRIGDVKGPITKNPFALRMKFVDPKDVTYNNPVLIADRDGTVHALFCIEYMRCFTLRSADDGVTWSEPVEITSVFEGFRKAYDWKVLATGPNHGIQLKNGRLIVPVWLSTGTGGNAHRPSVTATLFSDDGGKTWQAGEIAVPCTDTWINPNETVAVELSDGSVMLNVRNESKAHRRLVTVSADGATRWSTPRFDEALKEPICMGSIVRYPAKTDGGAACLLFSNPDNLSCEDGKEVPGKNRDRKNLSVKLSSDDGQTWPVSRVLEPGPSMYSDLAVAADGTVFCFFGRSAKKGFAGDRLTLARFNLEWLKEGRDARR